MIGPVIAVSVQLAVQPGVPTSHLLDDSPGQLLGRLTAGNQPTQMASDDTQIAE